MNDQFSFSIFKFLICQCFSDFFTLSEKNLVPSLYTNIIYFLVMTLYCKIFEAQDADISLSDVLIINLL